MIDEIGNFQDAVDLTAKLAGISGKPRLLRLNRAARDVTGCIDNGLVAARAIQRAKHEVADSNFNICGNKDNRRGVNRS